MNAYTLSRGTSNLIERDRLHFPFFICALIEVHLLHVSFLGYLLHTVTWSLSVSGLTNFQTQSQVLISSAHLGHSAGRIYDALADPSHGASISANSTSRRAIRSTLLSPAE